MKKIAAFLLCASVAAAALGGCAKVGNTAGTEEIASASEETESSTAAVYSDGIDENGYFEDVRALDYVTLPTYMGVAISTDVTQADADEVESQIELVLEDNAVTTEVYDRAVADGDTVNIDYVGSVDGVEFDGGSTDGAGTEVTIGVTSYIDDFLEQLIGHVPGENFNIEVTFPDDYGVDELNGKDAVFNVTINNIVETVTPTELTDDIAEAYDFDSAEAMRADIEAWVIANQKTDFVDDLLADAVISEVPQSVLDQMIAADVAYYENSAAAYGMDVDTFFSTYVGYESEEAYIEANMDGYTSTATQYLVIQAVAEAEGLVATDDDIVTYSMSDYVTDYGAPYIKMYLLQRYIVPNYIVDHGVQE